MTVKEAQAAAFDQVFGRDAYIADVAAAWGRRAVGHVANMRQCLAAGAADAAADLADRAYECTRMAGYCALKARKGGE